MIYEFDKELLKYLEKWCDKESDDFVKIWFDFKKSGEIYVYRYNGTGIKGIINTFKTDYELQVFKKNNEKYIKDCIEFDKEIMKEIGE